MFLIAASFINGKQANTAFTEGVDDMASQIQEVIEQVTDGQYSDIPLTCQASATGLSFPDIVNSQPIQGTNSQCVFLGKVLHFSVGGDPAQYEIFSMAAARESASVTDLASTPYQPIPTLTTQPAETPQSLSVSCVEVNTTAACNPSTGTYAIGFLQSLGTAAGGGVYASGAQTVVLSSTNSPRALQAAQSADICVTDGQRYADISIGTVGGNPLSVNVIRTPTTECPQP
jgi:hypothetical protein